MVSCIIRDPGLLASFSPFSSVGVRFPLLAANEEDIVQDIIQAEPLTWPRDTAPLLRDVSLFIFRITIYSAPQFILQNDCRALMSRVFPIIRWVFEDTSRDSFDRFAMHSSDFEWLMQAGRVGRRHGGSRPGVNLMTTSGVVSEVVGSMSKWDHSIKVFGLWEDWLEYIS